MQTLEQIAADLPTDKKSVHSYLPFYDRLLAAFRNSAENVLEIGVDGGGSLVMWNEFFKNSYIFGIDINQCPELIKHRAQIFHCQADAYMNDFSNLFPVKACGFDLIVDDGPHTKGSQEFFCEHYPKLLVPGGIAIVEDIQDPAFIPDLVAKIPAGFHSAVVDLRHVKGRWDDLLILIYR